MNKFNNIYTELSSPAGKVTEEIKKFKDVDAFVSADIEDDYNVVKIDDNITLSIVTQIYEIAQKDKKYHNKKIMIFNPSKFKYGTERFRVDKNKLTATSKLKYKDMFLFTISTMAGPGDRKIHELSFKEHTGNYGSITGGGSENMVLIKDIILIAFKYKRIDRDDIFVFQGSRTSGKKAANVTRDKLYTRILKRSGLVKNDEQIATVEGTTFFTLGKKFDAEKTFHEWFIHS